MSQTPIRCIIASAILSAAVGGLAYAQAENRFNAREASFRRLAEDECLAHGPPSTPDERHFDAYINKLEADDRLCVFALAGEIKTS